jgi:RNA polymerase sigma-70 factor (ECF subfamily)
MTSAGVPAAVRPAGDADADSDTDADVDVDVDADVEDTPAGAPDATAAFEAFYRAHADTVRRALAVTLGDAQVAAEATDEAMTRALARWRRVSVHESPAGWVYRVGLNWAISRWRRQRREAPLDAGDGGDAERTVDPPDPVAAAAGAALRTLPLDQRAVVVCRVLLECSTGETAALLRIPTGTVKSRLARGLALLRTTIDSLDEEER